MLHRLMQKINELELSHVGPLMIIRRLAYTTGNRYLIIYW
jgi:hypothetical protein